MAVTLASHLANEEHRRREADQAREQERDARWGELVCTAPFPTMPLGFWNDPGDAKYRAAYYEKFPGA